MQDFLFIRGALFIAEKSIPLQNKSLHIYASELNYNDQLIHFY